MSNPDFDPATSWKRGLARGFTLLEIAISLVVIAVIVAGALGGRELLINARLKSVTADIQTINRAAQDFQKLYGALPGDLYDAPDKLGGAATLRGNGNGILEANNNFGDNEQRGFWQHLSLAKLLPENYSGTSDAPGAGVKAGRIANSGYFVSTNPASNELEISFSRFSGASGVSVLTPEQAWDIDKKNDDGKPNSGYILATEGSDAAANACVNGGAYNTSGKAVSCILHTRVQNTGTSVANTMDATATSSILPCPGGDGGVASTPVGGFRTCACASGMAGVCKEKCLTGAIWEYDTATSTCQYFCTSAAMDCGSGQTCTFPTTQSGSTATALCPAGYVGSPQRLCTGTAFGDLINSCTAAPTFAVAAAAHSIDSGGLNTGIDLVAGTPLRITSSGWWCGQTEAVPSRWADTNGRPGNLGCEGCWCPNLTNVMLIGRVGATYFPIGSNLNSTAPATGRLYLLINDCAAVNAAGTATVTVSY